VALADIPVTYVVGAPRSGTTWVQLMLGSHPEIATPIELDFFSSFVAPWYESWRVHRLAIDRPARPEWGLPAALTEEEFVEAVGLVVERVYRSVLAAKPGATLMLEKDPRYCSHVETILRTVPHAKFVHVLRDGRDVACSMTRVAQSWGRDWAPGGIGGGAALWQEAVRGAQTAATAPAGYLELRYEELLGRRGPDLLRELLGFCGVADDLELAGGLYDRYRYGDRSRHEVMSGGLTWAGEAARSGADVSFPEDFIGPGTAGRWQTQLDAADREAFDAVAGELLVELGYEADRSWAGGKAAAWSPIPTRR
jgi:sulfotransferase family protein